MTKEPKSKIASSEEQLQVVEDCRKMLEATGCDYMVSLFPCKNGSEEVIKAKVDIMNLVAHFNAVAEQTAERLGTTREHALIEMAAAGSMTTSSVSLEDN